MSHDRFFLDQVAETVVEVSDGKLTRYAGNYSQYREEKQKPVSYTHLDVYKRQGYLPFWRW